MLIFDEVNASYGCSYSFFPSTKKSGLEPKSELKFCIILTYFLE